MGFLKFLKREKKEETLEDFDLPPEPPPLEGFDKEAMEFPELPELEESKQIGSEFPKFDFQETEEKLPEFAELPELPEEKIFESIPPINAPSEGPEATAPQAEEQKPIVSEPAEPRAVEAYPKTIPRIFEHERKPIRERTTGRSTYIKVDNFKAMLGTINVAKSDLRKSEESLTKLESINSSKDRSLEKAKVSLDDLQRKLVYIDKTLFKGE